MATFVLIHGAGDVGWYWHLTEAELRARGHETIAPDLPCDNDTATLDDYVGTVAHRRLPAAGRPAAPRHRHGRDSRLPLRRAQQPRGTSRPARELPRGQLMSNSFPSGSFIPTA